jgi:hypothetical protein
MTSSENLGVAAQNGWEPAMQTYNGSCHCGAVRFSIEADLSLLTRCNCSICTKEGMLGTYVPKERFHLLKGQAELTLYQFNKKIAKHFFCKHCGIHAFRNPRSYPDSYVVNVRCLDDFDLETAKYEVKLFDGRNFEAAQQARLASASSTPNASGR